MSKTNAEIKICKKHKPQNLGYNAAHADAEKRLKKGQKQKFCTVCNRWFWKDEF